jgi:hypothetical protein
VLPWRRTACSPKARITCQCHYLHPTPKSSGQPVLQVCLAWDQQGPVPNSFTGREDVNRGQGAGRGQRRLSLLFAPYSVQSISHSRGAGTGRPAHQGAASSVMSCSQLLPRLPYPLLCCLLAGLLLAHLSSLTDMVQALWLQPPPNLLSLGPGLTGNAEDLACHRPESATWLLSGAGAL